MFSGAALVGGGQGQYSSYNEFKDTPFKEMTKCLLDFKLCMILVLSEQRLMDTSLKMVKWPNLLAIKWCAIKMLEVPVTELS